jgi:leucyl aminopeptidase (aminopeptidase T)
MLVSPSSRRPEEDTMPLYLDVHNIEGGVSAADVAKAHEADVAHQKEHGVNYKQYWVDEKAGKIFCLVEAPNPEAASTVHREAHGLVADEIFEVTEG